MVMPGGFLMFQIMFNYVSCVSSDFENDNDTSVTDLHRSSACLPWLLISGAVKPSTSWQRLTTTRTLGAKISSTKRGFTGLARIG